MKRSPMLTPGLTRTLNPKPERFIRVNPTNVYPNNKKASLGPQNGNWLERASFIEPLQNIVSLQSFIVGVNHPFMPHPTCKAYPIAILMHGYCATSAPPPTPPPCVCYTPYSFGDGNIAKADIQSSTLFEKCPLLDVVRRNSNPQVDKRNI